MLALYLVSSLNSLRQYMDVGPDEDRTADQTGSFRQDCWTASNSRQLQQPQQHQEMQQLLQVSQVSKETGYDFVIDFVNKLKTLRNIYLKLDST
jgi:hypothetical protein